MIHLALQTEFNFKQTFQHMKEIHKYANGAVGIADAHNTFGHVLLEKESKKHGFKPIYGVRLFVLPDESKQRSASLHWIFLAKNAEGLKEIYEYVSKAYENFYYIPRLNYSDVKRTGNVVIISPIVSELADYIAVGQGFPQINAESDMPPVAIVTNNYPAIEDEDTYQLLAGARKGNGDSLVYNFNREVYPQHVLNDREFEREFPVGYALDATHEIADSIEQFDLPKAEMVRWSGTHDLKQFMDFKKVKDWDDAYQCRFDREMELITKKDYTDYFLIVADMIKHAKKTMLIGPARGSSAGSLVCYLMGITEVDPIKHGLIFERFIDINRHDLPDIDVDFPDVKREDVIKYLKRKYGENKVRAIANVNRLKAKSALGEFGKALSIPQAQLDKVKEVLIERMAGDKNANECLHDTFATTDVGKRFINQYPAMLHSCAVEGHASHAGKHAAGVLVSTEALTRYGSINSRDDVIQMDKRDAEYLGLLKIDCLGLRTLSILEGVAEQLGKPYRWFYSLPLDDRKTYETMTGMRLNGVFQFEGSALQNIVRDMGVNDFNDVVAITSLARPGALMSGGASKYVRYSTGADVPEYYSDAHREITGDTYGIIVYQEQVMFIAKDIGGMAWEDVSDLRRAVSKSMGEEYMAKFKDKFVNGAIDNGYSADVAEKLWSEIVTSGSYSFNKSHAVAYGYVSYWTAYCKTHFPSEFAVACLDNAADIDASVRLLRDLVRNEGFEYVPVDADLSGMGWAADGKRIIGALTNIKGIGPQKAKQIIAARKGNATLTPSLFRALMNPVTEVGELFPAEAFFGHLYADPISHGLDTNVSYLNHVTSKGEYVVIGRLIDKSIRDMNDRAEPAEKTPNPRPYLTFKIEDDHDSITCRINTKNYPKFGKEIAETGRVGKDWYLLRGTMKSNDYRSLDVIEIQNLNKALGVEPNGK